VCNFSETRFRSSGCVVSNRRLYGAHWVQVWVQSRCPKKKKPAAANLRRWRVIIIRSEGEYLGSVEAPDRERAEAVTTKLFDLDQDQRSRLLIRERL
jgi:hypothetical protein